MANVTICKRRGGDDCFFFLLFAFAPSRSSDGHAVFGTMSASITVTRPSSVCCPRRQKFNRRSVACFACYLGELDDRRKGLLCFSFLFLYAHAARTAISLLGCFSCCDRSFDRFVPIRLEPSIIAQRLFSVTVCLSQQRLSTVYHKDTFFPRLAYVCVRRCQLTCVPSLNVHA